MVREEIQTASLFCSSVWEPLFGFVSFSIAILRSSFLGDSHCDLEKYGFGCSQRKEAWNESLCGLQLVSSRGCAKAKSEEEEHDCQFQRSFVLSDKPPLAWRPERELKNLESLAWSWEEIFWLDTKKLILVF